LSLSAHHSKITTKIRRTANYLISLALPVRLMISAIPGDTIVLRYVVAT